MLTPIDDNGRPIDVAIGGFAVTPADDANLAKVARSLHIGTGGDVKVKGLDGNDVIFYGVLAGATLSCAVVKVYADGTTASRITAYV